jgi:undecaprenyl diphosphate synthase
MSRKVLPRHIGFIPDGNHRWAVERQLPKEVGYASAIIPGITLFESCRYLGIDEVSVYGFTRDNTRKPTAQTQSFRAVCVKFELKIAQRGAAMLVAGDERSSQFP